MQGSVVHKDYYTFLVLALLFIFRAPDTFCSEKENLLKEQERLRKEISLTNKLIDENRKQEKNSLNELGLINRKIEKRSLLIKNYQKQILQIETEILEKEATLNSLKIELFHKKVEYKEIIYEGYKRYNRYQEFMYILASGNINQFYSRIKYLQQISQNRKNKIELIKRLQFVINEKVLDLERNKNFKLKKITGLLEEKESLNIERKKSIEIVELLNDEKTSLLKDLNNKKRLEREISRMIDEIIKKDSRRNKYAVLTPEQKIIADNFLQNMGRLPWPTRRGIITEKFGEHNHPVLKGITTRSNGIDITTPKNTYVRSVFKGVVTEIFTVKGRNFTVIIRHGNFYTVYNNLSKVMVNSGDKVETEEVIGLLDTNEQSGNVVLHFQVWKELEKLNPEEWLSN